MRLLNISNGHSIFSLENIHVRLPTSWRHGCLSEKHEVIVEDVEPLEAVEADVDVVHEPFSGPASLPATTTYGQCGRQGKNLRLPALALASDKSLEESFKNAMLKEYVAFEFGVFPEDDAAACNGTNASFPCPQSQYDKYAHTKQNLLCDGKGILEIMLHTIDFEGPVKSSNSSQLVKKRPSFTYSFQVPKRAYVIVMERSDPVADHGKDQLNWENVQSAFLPFISNLPTGDLLSIITYGQETTATRVDLPFTRLSKDNRAKLHAAIPRRPLPAHDHGGCQESLQHAFNLVRKMSDDVVSSQDTNVEVILVARSSLVQDLPLDGVHHPVTYIGLTKETAGLGEHPQAEPQSLMGRRTYAFEQCEQPNECQASVISTLLRVLRDLGEARSLTVHHLSHERRVEGSGSFTVDSETVGKSVTIIATARDEKDFASLELTSPSGRQHWLPYYSHNMAFVDLADAEVGNWEYNVKTYQQDGESLAVSVDVFSAVEAAEAGSDVNSLEHVMSLDAWTVAEKEERFGNPRVMIYAQLEGGRSAHDENVTVIAMISRPGHGAAFPLVEIPLVDNGDGYPDVLSGDNIYSSYFTELSPQAGVYHVRIVAKGASFERHTDATPFYVPQLPNSFYVRKEEDSNLLVSDVFPPSRITDLSLVSALGDGQLYVTLKWTSGGGDYNHGTAFRYEIRCATSRAALREDTYEDQSIPVHASLIPRPEPFGSSQMCTVGVPWHDQDFYYAILAFDASGNRGLISNSIPVRIHSKDTTTTLNPFLNSLSGRGSVQNLPRQGVTTTGQVDKSNEESSYAWAIATGVIFSAVILAVVAYLCKTRCLVVAHEYHCDESYVSNTTETSSQGVCTDTVVTIENAANNAREKKEMIPDSKNRHHQEIVAEHSSDEAGHMSLEQKMDLWTSLGATINFEPRVHVMEDYSIYRDLSTMSDVPSDYRHLDDILSAILAQNHSRHIDLDESFV